MIDQAELEQFNMVMRRNAAQISSRMTRYVGRLGEKDREAFMTQALVRAWDSRQWLNPEQDSVAEWFEYYCLKPTAMSRREWTIHWSHGDEIIRGSDLGGW